MEMRKPNDRDDWQGWLAYIRAKQFELIGAKFENGFLPNNQYLLHEAYMLHHNQLSTQERLKEHGNIPMLVKANEEQFKENREKILQAQARLIEYTRKNFPEDTEWLKEINKFTKTYVQGKPLARGSKKILEFGFHMALFIEEQERLPIIRTEFDDYFKELPIAGIVETINRSDLSEAYEHYGLKGLVEINKTGPKPKK